ncbi:GIY-YIG nuclease family protein [Sphingomonas donggukensis]|uniref:GIY-YIG nuclease family protein n=1 Tax=Sphingomonas donggukensis TaxID=2949093 RepID=A0ABY4TVB4_9SPHN|nr:GIY-YIG nuclease family protein [Sphingomonas donggukensis]URW75109.1 GIY-YIG nuclease family protein [Sphingomonas donggukensis]
MFYVYILRSVGDPEQHYTGLTDDLRARLAEHNAGRSAHTAKYRPWILVSYTALPNRERAAAFERYLKSGSGRAFANRHLR